MASQSCISIPKSFHNLTEKLFVHSSTVLSMLLGVGPLYCDRPPCGGSVNLLENPLHGYYSVCLITVVRTSSREWGIFWL